MEDSQIIDLFWARNEQAIGESQAKYGRMLQGIAVNILHSREDGEECVNDTYRKAWDTIPPQRPGAFGAYLGRIVRNLAINRWHENHAKKRGAGAQVLLSELSDCIPARSSVEEEIEVAALSGMISRWLRGLTQEDRILFLRRYWFGDSIKSLAHQCASTPNHMAGRVYRLRQKLKATLEKEGIFL